MVLLLNTTETGERQRNIRKEAKAIHKQMNVHRLARQKKKKQKNCSRKQGGISQYHMANTSVNY
jgi:hypothetical protein